MPTISKMSYVPPHKRQSAQRAQRAQRPMKIEFPQLAPPKEVQPTNMDFKTLFKNVETKRKKREQRIKKGWIKLTKEGIVDSLTVEERKADDDYNDAVRQEYKLSQLVDAWDAHREMRLERDGYLSDYSVNPPSEEPEEVEDNEFEEDDESEDETEDPVHEGKWFTS